MTTEKQDPRIGKKRRLTGADWPDGLRGRVMTVTNVDEDDDLIIEDEEGQRWTIWTGMYDYSATHVDDDPPSPPADTRKRLREYDLSEGDVVVIAGVECAIGEKVYGDHATMWRLGDSRNDGFIRVTHGLVADMFVDEVRRAKRKVQEIVLRRCEREDDGSVALGIAGGGYFRIHDEREVDE